VWGGLWTPPEFSTRAAAVAALGAAAAARDAPAVHHAFTHFDLLIHPLWSTRGAVAVAEAQNELWYDAARPAEIGLPAPIAQLLQDPP
jgi:A/G-specific adenine glycosylase